jgi:pimeloyl-ACP methyl ester carboxylesterase
MLPLLLLPALVQTPPSVVPEQEIQFPGFNGFGLKGSVLTAEGSNYFAVLVAGAGATDRNWFNPALKDLQTSKPIQSHGGRDLAQWLKQQGIGSLRYDKRFVTSQEAGLDVSLDAQLGDLRAAIAAARTHAKGKKLLLVGHDEGALLALMTSGNADALLLLGMPPETIAKTLRRQIEAQIPPLVAGPNLKYLDAVFEAIRKGQPKPEPDESVHEFMRALGKSLMAPETLDFVRSTLDLDPWVLASHIALPTAMAWGDKDIQTPRPEKTPAFFRGTVLVIPDANHLLKQEPRPKTGMRPVDAVKNYGDATSLADLAPIAQWLKGLK